MAVALRKVTFCTTVDELSEVKSPRGIFPHEFAYTSRRTKKNFPMQFPCFCNKNKICHYYINYY